jgi:hypothetical protein
MGGEQHPNPPQPQHQAKSSSSSGLKHLTNRLLTTFLDEVDRDDVRKTMMDKLVAPTLKALYTQLMPYILVILGLMMCMLILMVLIFVLVTLQYCGSRKIARR